jgi:hypothetical protein
MRSVRSWYEAEVGEQSRLVGLLQEQVNHKTHLLAHQSAELSAISK